MAKNDYKLLFQVDDDLIMKLAIATAKLRKSKSWIANKALRQYLAGIDANDYNG